MSFKTYKLVNLKIYVERKGPLLSKTTRLCSCHLFSAASICVNIMIIVCFHEGRKLSFLIIKAKRETVFEKLRLSVFALMGAIAIGSEFLRFLRSLGSCFTLGMLHF